MYFNHSLISWSKQLSRTKAPAVSESVGEGIREEQCTMRQISIQEQDNLVR